MFKEKATLSVNVNNPFKKFNKLDFYTKTPDCFRKVDDIRLDCGKLIVEDRQNGKQIVLEASLPL